MGVKKEKFTNANEISNRITNMKNSYKKEAFTNLNEVSNRVQEIKKTHELSRVNEVSGLDNEAIAGNASLPVFMKEFEDLGTNVGTNTRIFTPSESTIPAHGTQNNFPRNNIHVPVVDDVSINTALAKTTSNNSLAASNLKSVEIDGKST